MGFLCVKTHMKAHMRLTHLGSMAVLPFWVPKKEFSWPHIRAKLLWALCGHTDHGTMWDKCRFALHG